MRPRNVIVMAVLALLCATLWWAFRDSGTATSTTPVLLRFRPDDVTALSMTAQGELMELRRDPDAGDRWQVKSQTNWIQAKPVVVEELLTRLAGHQVRDYFPPEELEDGDRAGFALAPPQAELTVQLPGESLLLRLGKETQGRSARYVDPGPASGIWVMADDPYEDVVNILAQGLAGIREDRLATSHVVNLRRIEILDGQEAAVLDAAKDMSGIWKVTEPFAGYADPVEFETRLAQITATRVDGWVEDSVQVLSKYGLDPPAYTVRLTSARSEKPTVIQVGMDVAESPGAVYAMLEGVPSVAVMGPRFREAVMPPYSTSRDHSFTRIGIDCTGIVVRIGGVKYTLRKVHQDWDIVDPPTHPAEEAEVRRAVDAVRSWHTKEFLDGVAPLTVGIDGEDMIILERAMGEPVRLLLGDRAEDGTWHAQREGDGGVEKVLPGPVEILETGWEQFKRRIVKEYITEDLLYIGRSKGLGEESRGVQDAVFKRDLTADDKRWRDSRSGKTGSTDDVALTALIGALRTVRTIRWVHFDFEKRQDWGIHPDMPHTTRIDLSFDVRTGLERSELEQTLVVGKPHPDGGYYAHLRQDPHWAFVLPDSVVKVLTADLITAE